MVWGTEWAAAAAGATMGATTVLGGWDAMGEFLKQRLFCSI